jgi:uncharacterized protein (TIGR02246 family)
MFDTVRAVIFAAAAAAAPATAAPADTPAHVSQVWACAWQAKRLDAVLALYTPDAVFLDANGSRVTGRPALRVFFAKVLGQYSAEPQLRSIGGAVSGDLAYDWGEYREIVTPIAHPAGAIRTEGSYLVILRRVSGRWLIAEQMWTGNAPVPVRR